MRAEPSGLGAVTVEAALATHGIAEVVVPFPRPLTGPVTLHPSDRSDCCW